MFSQTGYWNLHLVNPGPGARIFFYIECLHAYLGNSTEAISETNYVSPSDKVVSKEGLQLNADSRSELSNLLLL
jgi:hypothetical protein